MSWLDEPKFSVGSAVTLRSGGQAMTVLELDGGTAVCVWIDKSGRDRSRPFPVQCLIHDSKGAFNLIIEGFNATSDEIAELKNRPGGGHA